MHLHQLRHYSATELIAAGVDIRTVAGRLGHRGCGATTLRVYSTWVAEADQRAANSLATRMPELPAQIIVAPDSPTSAPSGADDSDHPYQRIAADLRVAIRCGALDEGDPLPSAKQLATRYGVSVASAHRSVSTLTESGEVVASRGRRAAVRRSTAEVAAPNSP